MKLDDLDEAVVLRNYRRRAITLRDTATGPCLLECKIGGMDVGSIISVMPIRETIEKKADEYIAELDGKLRALGVEP